DFRFPYHRRERGCWLGRQDSNLGMAESKSAALPLGYAPTDTGEPHRSDFACGGGTIAVPARPINVLPLLYTYEGKRALTAFGPRIDYDHELSRPGRRHRFCAQARCRPEN